MNIDKSQARIRTMFGDITGRYDFLNHFLSGGMDYYWRWVTVQTVPPRSTDPILDVCTGTGDLAIAYWKKSGGRAAVIGSDFTHSMLVRARAKADSLRSDGNDVSLAFVEADTLTLPFPDNSFQIVSVAFGLRNVSNTVAGLREMIRVCRTGGTVAVLELTFPTNPVWGAVHGFYFRHVVPRIGQLISRNRHSAYAYLPASVAEFPQGEALADMMRQCGLEAVAWKPLTFGVATLYYGRKGEGSNVPAASSV